MTQPVFNNRKHFPALNSTNHDVTSHPTPAYNCIAWAAGDDQRWWWPLVGGYWPAAAPRELTLEAFVAAFGTLGYQECNGGHLEYGFEKVVIYAKSGVPKHAARQLPDGSWTSKLGRDADISHKLLGVCGDLYGSVAKYLRRPLSAIAAPSPPEAQVGDNLGSKST